MSDTNEIFLLHSLLLADFTTIVVSICSTEQSLTRTQDYPINKLGQGVKKVCGAWRSSSKSPRPASSIQSSRLQVSLNLINSLLESDIVLLLLRTFVAAHVQSIRYTVWPQRGAYTAASRGTCTFFICI